MIKTLECPHCGQLNHVDTERFGEAMCGACGRSFSSAAEPQTAVRLEAAPRLEALPAGAGAAGSPRSGVPDVSRWISKIGGSGRQEAYVRKGFLHKVKKNAASIPFVREAVAMYYCAMDRKTPLTAKLTAIGALAYIVLPIDAIPDFIAVLGFTDDAAAFWAAYRSISTHVTEEHRQQADAWFAG